MPRNRQCVAEGLVELVTHRGARVVEHDRDDLDAVFTLRAHAEGLAARAAAERAVPADTARLQALADGIAAAAAPPEPDLDTVYALNRRFHDLLLDLAGSPVLRQVVDGLVHSSVLLRTYQAFDAEALRRSCDHHREVVAAVRAA